MSLLAELARDRRGVAAPVTALGLTVVLGFVGLGVDLGHGYLQRRTAQHAADSAAFSAAAALTRGGGDAAAEARAVAARYGFPATQVAVNLPPTTGPNTGRAGYVEVLAEQPGRRFFASLIGVGPSTIRARAVAVAGTPGDACVLALNANASASALWTGSADIKLNGCSLFANSSSVNALELKGGAKLAAKSVGLVGGYSQSSNSTLTTTEGVHTSQAPVEDPYKNVAVPSNVGCDATGASSYGPRPDGTPRVFCNGLSITSSQSVRLDPGVYIVKGALNVSGTLTGSGVTIVLTSDGGAASSLTINGSATIDLSAPTTGPTAGLIFFQDPNAPGADSKITGSSSFRLDGALYFPRQKVSFRGTTDSVGGCTQIVAGGVEFTGDASLGLNCAGKGVTMAGGRRPAMIE